jgi:serine/threonine-protein kinase
LSLDPEVPDFYAWLVPVYLLWDGNTGRARKLLKDATDYVDDAELTELLLYLDILDGRYDAALSLLSSASSETVGPGIGYAGSYIPRVQYMADIYRLIGENRLAQTYQDSARVLIESKIRKSPDDPDLHAALGIAFAGLGFREDAIREGKLACDLRPLASDAITGYYRAVDLAKIYTKTGELEDAIDLLDHLLSTPGTLSTELLKLDPVWAPLREQPQFQELLDEFMTENQ